MPLPIGSIMPSFSGATEWLVRELASDDLRGHPVLVQFWSRSCPVCKINLPVFQQFEQTYAAHDLRLISIHKPMMEADMDVGRVKAAQEEMGLDGPCAIDNAHVIADRFQTGGVWPSYFLFDAEGRLRSRAAGALGLKMAENSLKRLFGTADANRKLESATS